MHSKWNKDKITNIIDASQTGFITGIYIYRRKNTVICDIIEKVNEADIEGTIFV